MKEGHGRNKRTVIVAGAQGVAGRAALEHYAVLPGTLVYGLSRRAAQSTGNVHHISVDLLDCSDIQAKVGHLSEATHLVFGAYIEKPTAAAKTAANVAILKNLLDVLEKIAPALEHITLYHGGKAYGSDLGPFKTPAREDDPRLMPPNFSYDQEDLLRARQKGKNWHFTVLRPEAISGFALVNPMSLATVIAVYAAISRELGLPLRFPGTEKAYRALYQLTSAECSLVPRPGPETLQPHGTRSSTSQTWSATPRLRAGCGKASCRSEAHCQARLHWRSARPFGGLTSARVVLRRSSSRQARRGALYGPRSLDEPELRLNSLSVAGDHDGCWRMGEFAGGAGFACAVPNPSESCRLRPY